MTAIRPFDPAEPVTTGRTIIEASAGAGKTFTIAATVTRLVAVDGIPLERILVVTFTRAATAELKGRVRKRLVETERALAGHTPADADDHLQFLHGLPSADLAVARQRLDEAIAEFDQAQIFTIHGFAQRLLGQLGFRARVPEDLVPGEVDDLALRQAASDLAVSRFAEGTPDGFVTPDEAARMAAEVLAHPDARVVPDPAEAEGPARLRVELALAVAEETQRRMRRAASITYDDILTEVRDALSDPEVGAEATELLRRRYDVGMVDESQDTDPIQWQIIRRIFDGARLVVIGDPKQSIYSFRGADIEAYLATVSGASAIRTLDTNWRSDAPLVEALDLMLEGTTFGDERIAYRRMRARHPSRIEGVAPITLRVVSSDLPIERYARDPYYRVGPAREAIAADVAARIVELLESGVTITDDEGPRPLGPADIAVLCRRNDEVEMVRGQLQRRQVPSVSSRSGSVLLTGAAEDWRRFLLAVERPDRMDLVRLAATTSLVGHPVEAVAALDDEAALELQRQMRAWHEILQRGGVPALFADLNQRTGLSRRILSLPDGERRLTDIIHIAEEMHSAFRHGRHGSLSAWLEASIAEADQRDNARAEEIDSRQRRLETDADAVTVQTIHGAKGLQWPVVLVPFSWDAFQRDPEFPVFHEPHPRPGGEPRRRVVDLSGKQSPNYAEHCRLAKQESLAEQSRLLYVALTRAEHHLEVWWVPNHKHPAEKLAELMNRHGSPEALAERSGGKIAVSYMNELAAEKAWRVPASPPRPLEVMELRRELDHTWRRVSFSSLSADQPLTAAEEAAEDALRTDEAEPPDEEADEEAAPAPLLPLADMPAGARFGTLVHAVLEHLRFDAEDIEGRAVALLAEQTRAGDWEFDPRVLASALAAVAATPLGPSPDDPTLVDLEAGGMSRELTFELPVRTDAAAISLSDIGRVMSDYVESTHPYRAHVDELIASPGQPFRGFMAGAIDLVATRPDGRFVVMDYKSNLLPSSGPVASPEDYGPAALAHEMVSHRYVLQATLYQVALHRYLQWRLPGYDPERHLGGSTYLFIRGMIGPDTPVIDGERCGVARWLPPAEMVVRLSQLFDGEAS